MTEDMTEMIYCCLKSDWSLLNSKVFIRSHALSWSHTGAMLWVLSALGPFESISVRILHALCSGVLCQIKLKIVNWSFHHFLKTSPCPSQLQAMRKQTHCQPVSKLSDSPISSLEDFDSVITLYRFPFLHPQTLMFSPVPHERLLSSDILSEAIGFSSPHGWQLFQVQEFHFCS